MWLSYKFEDWEIALDFMCGPKVTAQEGHSQTDDNMMVESEGQSDSQKGSWIKECKWHLETLKARKWHVPESLQKEHHLVNPV